MVQAALAQRKSQIETHGPTPFKRQSLRQQGRTELDEGMLAWALALVIKSKQDNPL